MTLITFSRLPNNDNPRRRRNHFLSRQWRIQKRDERRQPTVEMRFYNQVKTLHKMHYFRIKLFLNYGNGTGTQPHPHTIRHWKRDTLLQITPHSLPTTLYLDA